MDLKERVMKSISLFNEHEKLISTDELNKEEFFVFDNAMRYKQDAMSWFSKGEMLNMPMVCLMPFFQ